MLVARVPAVELNPASKATTAPAESSRTAAEPCTRLPTGHEDVFTAVVVERFPGESAIESLEAQARDVEEPQPFVLGCPPERTGFSIVQGDVDPVVADAVGVRVRQRGAGVRVGMPAV